MPGAAVFWLPAAGRHERQVRRRPVLFPPGGFHFFFLLVVVLMGCSSSSIAASRRPAGKSPSHNTLLEIIWTVIPVAIVASIFYQGFTATWSSPRRRRGLGDRVTAQKWSWTFDISQWPGHAEDLHVPVDEPVLLTMTSEDVIHSLFIPAFRVKMDVVPGRYTYDVVPRHEAGRLPALCSEYCGTGHSTCARVIVQTPADYHKWLAEAGDMSGRMTPGAYGEAALSPRGCDDCHSLDGTAGTGPSFKGIYGRQTQLDDGSAPSSRWTRLHPRRSSSSRERRSSKVSARDAHVQGLSQRQGHHGTHRLHQIAEIGRRLPSKLPRTIT